MEIRVTSNIDQIIRRLGGLSKQVPFATAVAINRTAEWIVTDERREMRQVFDRPTRWVLQALRIGPRATKTKPSARVWFKDRSVVSSSSDMLTPHIYGGSRAVKAMESRLHKIGVLPAGWFVVPGEGAALDGNGNMSRGQISLILNYLGAYTEDGYNKIGVKDRARYAKGTRKRRGFVMFVARPGNKAGLTPGVYQRTALGFGQAIKPLMIFVQRVNYRKRLDFYGIAKRTIAARFESEFHTAFERAKATAFAGRP